MKKTNEQKGITLVALIITIIVLLILAVVAISAVSGDGIIQHAQDSTANYKVKQAEEAAQLILDEWKIVKHTTKDADFLTFLQSKVGDNNVEKNENVYELTIDGQKVNVTESTVISSLGSGTTGGENDGSGEIPTTVNYVKIGDLVYLITSEENKTAAVYGARAEGVDYSDSSFAIMNDSVAADEVIIASQVEINGKTYTVTELGYWGFKGASNLKKITIPGTITEMVSVVTFGRCTSLETVIMQEGVEIIGTQMFMGCTALKNVTIPSTVTAIPSSVFEACTSLTEIVIPEGVTKIDYAAFGGCTSLESVTIPETVTEIDSRAFENTPWMQTKTSENNGLLIINGILVNGKNATGEITIPNTVKSISEGAFSYNKSISAVTIPESVITVGLWIFEECSSLQTINVYWENNIKPEGWKEYWNASSVEPTNLWTAPTGE